MKDQQKLRHYDDPKKVGRRVREARGRAGLSQRQLSFPGCTAAYVSRIEKGDRVPSLQILREFSRRLGVSEGFLARGVDDAPPADPLLEAEVAIRLDDLELARELLDVALTRASSDLERARISAGFGHVALNDADPHGAVELFERALSLHPPLEELDPNVGYGLGRAFAMAAEYESAIAVFERNFARAKARQDRLEQVRFGAMLANALVDSGNFAGAESALAQIIDTAGESGDPLAQARLLWSQSRLHALKNDSAAAARYARKAMEVLEVSDYAFYAAVAHQLLAHIELDRGNTNAAIELLDSGLPLIEQSGSVLEKALFRLEKARALLQLGRKKEAAAVAMGTLDAFSDSASPVDSGRSYALVADVFLELGDPARAIELYELAVEALQRSPTRYLVEVYAKLAELLEKRGRKDEALALLKQAMSVQAAAGRPLVAPPAIAD